MVHRYHCWCMVVRVVPVVANVLARPESDPEVIRRLLVEQVTGRVRWRESVLAMVAAGTPLPLNGTTLPSRMMR